MLLFVIFCFIFPIHLYLYWRLGTSPWDALWLAVPLLLIASFPFKRIHRIQRQLIFVALGVITYLALGTILRDGFYLATGTLIDRYWVILFTLVVMVGGTIHAMLGPHPKHVRLPIEGLPAAFEGLKIVQLSDLHIGPTVRRRYVQKVVERTMALAPDLIALTGDIGDGPTKIYAPDSAPLANLRAPLGIFYVSGNHEHYWGVDDWMDVMRGHGMRVLKNEVARVTRRGVSLAVAGIPDPVSLMPVDLQSLAQQCGDSAMRLILSHRPGVARKAEAAGFQLQLSGHTHGGQFFPWTLVVRFAHEFHKGLERVGKMWIYVNVGTGSWGPKLRVGSTTEITLIELTSAQLRS